MPDLAVQSGPVSLVRMFHPEYPQRIACLSREVDLALSLTPEVELLVHEVDDVVREMVELLGAEPVEVLEVELSQQAGPV